MHTSRNCGSLVRTRIVLVTAALALAACGGGSSGESTSEASAASSTCDRVGSLSLPSTCGGTPTQQSVSSYLRDLPSWQSFSPRKEDVPPTAGTPTPPVAESVQGVEVRDPVTDLVTGYRSEEYLCTTTPYTLTATPEKIVMFSPDREILWPGALLQGRSHRDGLGSLLPLSIRERAAIKVSIPSLARSDNFRVVAVPDQAEVNQAIGSMIAGADATSLVTPSTIQFVMEDYNSEQAFALQAKASGRYMGFSASASGSVKRESNEHTVMVYFFEKMYEVVVEPPGTPGEFFSDAFNSERLDEQIALGKIGPDNPPLYVSNVVYGRMMAFAFTSTASSTEIKAALSAAYKGIFSVSGSVSTEQKKILERGKISVSSLGGESKATLDLIASGDWKAYFTDKARLTSAYPLSYTFRNLRDGSIASVSESTDYHIKSCEFKGAAFSGFVLDSFETRADFDGWAGSEPALGLSWGEPYTPQSMFYGYVKTKHVNVLVDPEQGFLYDVYYLVGPQHFRGSRTEFYKGELSFWYRPDEFVYNLTIGDYCVNFGLFKICHKGLVQANERVGADRFRVRAFDDVTTFDQVVLRGGTPPYGVLTITYNPKQADIGLNWRRHSVPLTNDSAFNSQCDRTDPGRRGCWLVEDRVASEDEIKYVLAKVTDFRLRASYPLQRRMCADGAVFDPAAPCTGEAVYVPYGYVAGYFDEVRLGKSTLGATSSP